MSAKLDELINNAKITELLNKKKQEEENKSCILLILAIIGAVAPVAGIAFAVYHRYMNPKYSDFDGDFDYDEFEDDFEDDDCEDDGVYVKTVK